MITATKSNAFNWKKKKELQIPHLFETVALMVI